MSLWPPIFPNKNKKIKSRAFSLVELLIAVSIFSVVSLAIYSTFSSGAAVLRRVKNIDLVQQKILLKIESFSRQLRQQPESSKLLFAGGIDRLSFPAHVDYFPCRLTYYFDLRSKTLKQVVDKLSNIIDDEGKLNPDLLAKPAIFLSNVKAVEFSYLYKDSVKNEYLWTALWDKKFLPVAVKITIFSQQKKYESTVYLPKA
ncbi:MAG: prepilin-type N-terminal cleavage/methylation domain-containing protein [Candidatus Omnitrophota bacterium]